EDRRHEEEAPAVLVPLGPPPAPEDPRPLLSRVGYVGLRLLPLRLAEDRSEVDIGVEAVPEPEPLRPFHQLRGELLGGRLLDVDPIDADADLAHVREGPLDAGRRRLFDIRILADDEGGGAPQ